MSLKLYKIIEQFFDNPKDALTLKQVNKKNSVCNIIWKVSPK